MPMSAPLALTRSEQPSASLVGQERFQAIGRHNIQKSAVWSILPPDVREAVQVVATVLPFRTNAYVLDQLIDWSRVPEDPMFQLTFPQEGMLAPDDFRRMANLLKGGASNTEVKQAADEIRLRLNPHPAGQLTHNAPRLHGKRLEGVQHKYRETVLFFPNQGQTCHAYCTFCFRWAQFVGMPEVKMASKEIDELVGYLKAHRDITNVLITGGDPMIMRTDVFERYVEPLLSPQLEHIRHIRIGTKSVAYWPQRFVTDLHAGEMLRLFERIVDSGRHLAVMGHYNHPVEISTPIAQEAIRRIRATGANIRMQSPVVRHVNDKAELWAELWRTGTQLGCIPYYMFVERDTGARNYFELPLVRAWEIFRDAYQQVSGLARTARGPSMSAFPGKVRVVGVSEAAGQKVFVLEYLQARDPDWVGRPFFAKFDEHATWFDQLEPAFPSDEPFFATKSEGRQPSDLVMLDDGE
jgi:KamA family protein